MTNNSHSTATADARTSNVVQFRPRPSSEAVAWVYAQDPSPRARAVGRALAAHAQYQASTVTWRHLRRGDLAAWPSYDTLAREMRASSRTVKRGMAELIAAGLERRRTLRSNSYVFPSATERRQPVTPCVTPAVTLCVTPKEPRTEPRREPVARAICFRCGGSWPASYGFRCRACERDTRDPCLAPFKWTDGDEHRCTRCATCRPDVERSTELAIRLMAKAGKVDARHVVRFRAWLHRREAWENTRLIGRLRRGETVPVWTPIKAGLSVEGEGD